jgi:thiol peroxidase
MTTETTQLKGNVVNLTGNLINVGDKAPVVTVTLSDLSEKKVGGENDKTQLLIVVPSLDTEVCARETRAFNEKVNLLGIVDITVISMDLPFASKRFCSTEGIDAIDVASDFVEKEFSKTYGVLIKDSVLKGLSARAIFVINEEGIVTYKELVPEITSEPNYDAVLDAVKDA